MIDRAEGDDEVTTAAERPSSLWATQVAANNEKLGRAACNGWVVDAGRKRDGPCTAPGSKISPADGKAYCPKHPPEKFHDRIESLLRDSRVSDARILCLRMETTLDRVKAVLRSRERPAPTTPVISALQLDDLRHVVEHFKATESPDTRYTMEAVRRRLRLESALAMLTKNVRPSRPAAGPTTST